MFDQQNSTIYSLNFNMNIEIQIEIYMFKCFNLQLECE